MSPGSAALAKAVRAFVAKLATADRRLDQTFTPWPSRRAHPRIPFRTAGSTAQHMPVHEVTNGKITRSWIAFDRAPLRAQRTETAWYSQARQVSRESGACA
jgi:hypothetical protein